MKRQNKRLVVLFLCAIMMFSLCTPAFASSNYSEEVNLQQPLESEASTDILYDSCELDKGTMYLKENSEYRIVYIVFDEGYISYAICYKDNPKVVHTGYYYPNEQQNRNMGTSFACSVEPDAGSASIVEELLVLEPENTIDFAARATANNPTITTEEQALEYAEDYAPGWKTPVNSWLVGVSAKYDPVIVKLYEHISGTCTEENVVNYYVNDTLVSLAALFFKLNVTKIKNVVTNVFDGVSDYVAQKNGTLAYFELDNTRNKTARIDGKTWYFATWERTYCVYSGDKSTKVEQLWDWSHSDYNEDITYFADKAYSSYTNQY